MVFVQKPISKVLQKAVKALQFLPSSYSAIPSFIFFISLFVMLYQYFHQFSTAETKCIAKIKRELKFQLTYFTFVLAWYFFISCFRKMIASAEDYVKANPEEGNFNLMITYIVSTIYVTSVAIFPNFLIYANYRAIKESEIIVKRLQEMMQETNLGKQEMEGFVNFLSTSLSSLKME